MRFFLVVPLTAEACQALGWNTSVGATLNPVSDDNTPLTETGISGVFLEYKEFKDELGDSDVTSNNWEAGFHANDVGVGIVEGEVDEEEEEEEDSDFQF